jgi:hypothetical protein
VKHYEKRFQVEKEKVEQERQLADVLQKEFAVRAIDIILPRCSFLWCELRLVLDSKSS